MDYTQGPIQVWASWDIGTMLGMLYLTEKMLKYETTLLIKTGRKVKTG